MIFNLAISLDFLVDFGVSNGLPVNEECHPFLYYFFPIHLDEFYGCRLVFAVQRVCTGFLSSFNPGQLSIFDNQIKDTFFSAFLDVNVNRLMLVRKEVKDKTKIFEDFSHISLSCLNANIHFLVK